MKTENLILRLPLRMRKQLNKLSASLNVSTNTLLTRMIQERLEVAELWPPPYDDSHLSQPRRKPLINPRSVFTREQQGFDPVITDPDQLAFLEETKCLIAPTANVPPAPTAPSESPST